MRSRHGSLSSGSSTRLSLQPSTMSPTASPKRARISASVASPPPSSAASCSSAPIASSSSAPYSIAMRRDAEHVRDVRNAGAFAPLPLVDLMGVQPSPTRTGRWSSGDRVTDRPVAAMAARQSGQERRSGLPATALTSCWSSRNSARMSSALRCTWSCAAQMPASALAVARIAEVARRVAAEQREALALAEQRSTSLRAAARPRSCRAPRARRPFRRRSTARLPSRAAAARACRPPRRTRSGSARPGA